MTLGRAVLVSLIPTFFPLAAGAQGDDASYCASLSALANRYLVTGSREGSGVPDLETLSATNECAKGNFAAGIAALERKLRNGGFTLPKHP
jgi:hypothetical protein